MLNRDTIREATRLTHAGKLVEATALLQRMLSGERAPDATSRPPGRVALPGREPPTIDVTDNDVVEIGAYPARAPSPRRLQPLFDRAKDGAWLGMRGVRRIPASKLDIVPASAKFIEAAYSNSAGGRDYKLFAPSGLRGAATSLDRDASRLHPVAGRFRRRYENELHRRRTNLLRGVSCTAQRSQPVEVLELVSHRRSATWRR